MGQPTLEPGLARSVRESLGESARRAQGEARLRLATQIGLYACCAVSIIAPSFYRSSGLQCAGTRRMRAGTAVTVSTPYENGGVDAHQKVFRETRCQGTRQEDRQSCSG
jgi:hypothetical protein